MLAFVPVTFDLYRPLKLRLRWAMQCLVSFADHAGRCWPSIRKLAEHAGISKSAAQRDLADLVAAGLVTRKRRPGGVYVYWIDRRFLPAMAPRKLGARKLSQLRTRKSEAIASQQSSQSTGSVPEQGSHEEKPSNKKNQGRFAGRSAGFVSSGGMTEGFGLPDQSDQWKARLRSWKNTGGRFWLPQWGPRPNEPGCFAPLVAPQGIIEGR